MNLLQISLTNQCNLSCDYCPVKPWRNNPNCQNLLTNERLFLLLERLDPQEWAIELTGGEPALYSELDELLSWLQAKAFRGLIKTNGTLPIRRVPSFKIVVAFHNLQKPPKWFDEILIIAHTPDFNAKKEWCRKNGIEYKVIERDTYDKPTGGASSGRIMFVTPEGHKSECSAGTQRVPLEEAETPTRNACPGCKTFRDFNIFFKET
ncbi:MAG: hypothetical protein LBC75_02685 [Fibromonadaceae bacterium]|jgi:organic radical activating enzyme|nr:hypothetical protein [Fibromonadaceae bacterium]